MQEQIDQFLAYLQDDRHAAENTIQSYERDLRHFKDFLSGVSINRAERVTATNVMSYILHMQKNASAAASITRSLASIRAFYRFLFKKGMVKTDPTERLETPHQEKKLPFIMSREDVETLLDQPNKADMKGVRDKAMLELLYATGLRVSELISLSVRDVNTRLRYIHCANGSRERIIPIGVKAAEALTLYVDTVRAKMVKDQNESILFINRNGMPMTRQGFWKIVKHYATMAHIDGHITPHALRHSFAAHMIANGADMQSVQEMLGHADISTTQMYVNLKKDKLRDVYAKTHPRY